MKRAKKLNFLEWNNDVFVSSIKKIDLNIILTIILDALFYFLSGYLLILWLQRIQSKMAAFNLPSDAVALGYQKAQHLIGEIRTFYYLIIFSFILISISVIFLASILKGIIWALESKISEHSVKTAVAMLKERYEQPSQRLTRKNLAVKL